MERILVATAIAAGFLFSATSLASAQTLSNAYAAPGYVPQSAISIESGPAAAHRPMKRRVPVVRR